MDFGKLEIEFHSIDAKMSLRGTLGIFGSIRNGEDVWFERALNPFTSQMLSTNPQGLISSHFP